MLSTFTRYAAAAGVVLATASCAVHDTETPPLSGPSSLALTLRVAAEPASIAFGPNAVTPGDQSVIKVTAIGPDGRLIPNLSVRLNIVVDGVAQDYGTLTNRSISTGSDGTTGATTYFAPPIPSNGVISNNCGGSTLGTCISIVATPTSSNFGTVSPEAAQVRLVPLGTILPPASLPTAAFNVSPSSPPASLPVQFDASASTAGTGAAAITSYAWSFGDGATGTGRQTTHTYSLAATYTVTLTVTNDRALSASITQSVTIGAPAGPSANFTSSPSAPAVGETVFFNGSTSTAGAGHTITGYRWSFGDGTTGSGQIVGHAFAAAGVYNVQLTVSDDAGLSNTSSGTNLTVGGAPPFAADFSVSPQAPNAGDTVVFDYRLSTTSPGQPIVSLDWNFGDNTPSVHCPGDPACQTNGVTTHAFATAGLFIVNLVATDSAGRTSIKSKQVTIGTGAPTVVLTVTKAGLLSVRGDSAGSTAASGSSLVTYTFLWGDSNIDTVTCGATPNCNPTVPHTYSAAGTYVVTLRVTDSLNRTGSASSPVTVP